MTLAGIDVTKYSVRVARVASVSAASRASVNLDDIF